jgi:hypothetical protein
MKLKPSIRLSEFTQLPVRVMPVMKFGKYQGKHFCDIKDEYLQGLLQSSEELATEIRLYYGLPTDQMTSHDFKSKLLNTFAEELRGNPLPPDVRREFTHTIQRILTKL